MTFESVESRERFQQELLPLLNGLPTDKLALFGLSACEHLRSFVAELAVVASVPDELISGLWKRTSGGDDTTDLDKASLEPAIADHMDMTVDDELEALALQCNAGLGLGLSLLDEWMATGDLAALVRLVNAAIGEFSEISAVEEAESVELVGLAESLRASAVHADQALHRARTHGQELARLARQWWLG